MAYNSELEKLVQISAFAGNRVDYTQGGGGNTSVKLDDKLMAIKASGYKLSDITTNNGFVTVDYNAVKDYYKSVDLSDTSKDFEKESAALHQSSVVPLPGMQALRPSVEVGFHSFLKKYVVHIHSAYVAVVVCHKGGERLMDKLLAGKDYGFIFIPYINPGFTLTHVMSSEIDKYQKSRGKQPDAIFMINHGLVVHSDDEVRAMQITEDINQAIREHFNIDVREFDKIELQKVGEDRFISKTAAVKNFHQKYGIAPGLFDKYPLYPDQLVYLNNALALTPDKIRVDADGVTYNCPEKEAVTLEETLAAFVFTLQKLLDNNLDISLMGKKDVDFINNWEAEKFRRSVAK